MTGVLDPQVVAFAVIAAVLTITPGADTILVIRNVMARGRGAGLLTTVGACCGLFIHAALSALGLSLILVQSATAFDIVKMIGAGYLVWLGGQSIRRACRPGPHGILGAAQAPPTNRRSFVEGLLSNVLNPKVALFYLAFLPQFMSPGDWVLGKSMLLAGIHWIEGAVWMSIVTLFVARLRSWISRSRVTRTIEAVTGVLLLGFAARLAMERTH